MSEIAVARAGPCARVLGQGQGWIVEDVVCTSGPHDRPFEEQHSRFSIAVVLQGTFQYRSSAARARTATELMMPGSLLLGNRGQCFECGHEHATGDRCLSFKYEPEFFERVAADAGVPRAEREFRALRLPAVRALSALVARARAAMSTRLPGWEEIALDFASNALRLANGAAVTTPAATQSTIARVTHAIRMAEQPGAPKIHLHDLAREARLSPYHFLRVFEQLTGVTPHQYVRRARLRDAAVRLASGCEKILDIAMDSGFEDGANFNRAFRCEFGIGPREFRRR